jgi:heme exporter protein B
VPVLFSALLAVQRSFALESSDSARDGLRLSGLDPAGIFVGKAAAVAVQLLVLEAILAIGVAVLYGRDLHGPVLLFTTCVLATVGLAASGTIYGVLASGLRVRETLLPLLMLPVVAPVLLAATRAWEAGLAGTPADGWSWLRILGVFAAVYGGIGVMAFGALLEDS